MRKRLLLPVCGRSWGVSAALICALAHSPLLRAQSGDPDISEVAAFGGVTFLKGGNALVGASTGTAFSRYGLALIEAAFSPLGSETLRHRTGVPVENSRLYDFNASFHIRVPVRERWAPYAILGGGLLFDSFRAISGGGGTDPVTGQPRPGGVVVAVDEFNFGFHTGAGLRYHIRHDWGIRPEFKVIVSNRTYTRFSVGIFYTLPSGWP